MSRQGLIRAADSLEDLARRLVAIRREDTGTTTEKPANELGHAVVRFAISLGDLATASESGYRTIQAMTEPDPGADPLGAERAELALLSAILAGDVGLDSLAWAELVRRKLLPGRGPGFKVPMLWPNFMIALEAPDADPADPMLVPARHLDVTLDAARDAIVAHRDPELWPMRSSGSGPDGIDAIGLTLVTTDDYRVRAALQALDSLPWPLSRAAPSDPREGLRTRYDLRVRTAVSAAGRLDARGRSTLRKAYRLGGMTTPDLGTMAEWFARLVSLYLERRVLPSEASQPEPAS